MEVVVNSEVEERVILRLMTALNRIQSTAAHNEIVVLIHPRRNQFLTLFLTVWLSLWTLGCLAAVYRVISGHEERLFIGVWLCLALMSLFVGWSAWLWNIFGVEKIVLSPTEFVHRRILFGHALTTKSIRCSDIVKIRIDGPFGSSLISREQLLFTTGTLSIDYRGDLFVFGYQLEQAEAVEIVKALGSTFRPQVQQALNAV